MGLVKLEVYHPKQFSGNFETKLQHFLHLYQVFPVKIQITKLC
jgi:hypothetical protein